MTTPPLRHRLRLLTLNLWHGLDHTHPRIMWPSENPMVRWHRLQAQRMALKNCLEESRSDSLLEVFCLQEVNPLHRRMKSLQQHLGMEGVAGEVNVGLRVGELSYPPFLQDGLGILWRGSLAAPQSETRILSGTAPEYKLPAPLNIPITFQLAERRGALLLSGQWQGKTLTFVNLHLHNGPPSRPECSSRRSREMDALMEWLDPWIHNSDAVFVSGDFNCERGHSELAPLVSAGFEEILTAQGHDLPTWDPKVNELAARSLEGDQVAPDEIEWDSKIHQIDHIFYKAKSSAWGGRDQSRPPWTFRMERVCTRPVLGRWISDHFGLLVDISWVAPEKKG